jgi:hypothetical protein
MSHFTEFFFTEFFFTKFFFTKFFCTVGDLMTGTSVPTRRRPT